jgi:Na+/pantothenate symporter
MVRKFLPAGLVGLVLAGIFSATLSMVTSDANTVSAVITRDIIPFLSERFRGLNPKKELRLARVTTFTFVFMTLIITAFYKDFGGVIGLIVVWFGALVGPTAVPMILGLVPRFKHSGSRAAISSIITGVVVFVLMKVINYQGSQALILALPTIASILVYLFMGFVDRNGEVSESVERLLSQLSLANVNDGRDE